MNTAKFALIYTSLVDAIIEYKKYERTAENFGKKNQFTHCIVPLWCIKLKFKFQAIAQKIMDLK